MRSTRPLIREALAAIIRDPHAPPAKRLPDLPDVYTYHMARHQRRGRHLFLYRVRPDGFVDVARLLHDAMDVASHVPDRFKE
jgi:toxin ParE1/3/4